MQVAQRKEVLTTGEVARICHVAARTVSKWFDTGKLPGYRIPGSKDRRIPLDRLVAFMRAHGIPLDGLDGGACRVLAVGRAVPPEALDSLRDGGRCETRSAANWFEAGVVAHRFRPHVVVLEVKDAKGAADACRNIKATAELSGTKVIAASSDLTAERSQMLLRAGFDACVAAPCSAAQLSAAVEAATNLIT